MSEAEDKVVGSVASALVLRLGCLWSQKGQGEVTYAELVQSLDQSDDLPMVLRSHFPIGRALNYAERKGLIVIDGEILWKNDYRASDDLILTPGPKSEWKPIRQIEAAAP